ncbi:MAG: class I SAM-dependent methyltransferase [Bacteroidia bacterium]|nr:class I SAM-dependent methyltransferase [Bacteroidia bacterium]
MLQPSISDFIEWDVATWGRCIPLWEKAIAGKHNLNCLEIGSHHGGLSLWLSTKDEVSTVLCTDIKDTIFKAAPLHQRFPAFSHKIKYMDLNILHSSYVEEFDVVVFKSVLGACARNDVCGKDIAMQNIYKALKKGGLLLFAENMQGHFLHQWLRKKFVSWSSGWGYCSEKEWDKWLEKYDLKKINHYGFFSVFGRMEWQRRILANADRIFNNVISNKNKFMCFGYAVK